MIQILPAIDIIGGKCVRLSQGDYNQCTTYTPTPADMARMYADAGVERIHVVDLDGAKSSCPANLTTLEEITALRLVKVE
jgi:phosphoribosylformimino-5-aminoimidazole carboxamide ribotide isomerase